MSSSDLARRAPWIIGIAILTCCSSTPPPAGGLLSSPAGAALAGSILFIANQDSDALHVYDTQAREFIPAPNWMFPLSVPTVRRPGGICGDAAQMFTVSTVDPVLGVIDAFNDLSTNDPPKGLRELGEVSLPGVASDVICTKDPAAVLAHKIAAAGTPALYLAGLGSGALVLDAPDGGLPDGGPDERHAISALPTAALIPFNTPEITCTGSSCSGTQIWEVMNDQSGAACGNVPGFCPTVQPLFSLPPQPAACAPVGPPLALRIDASGSNAGDVNLGEPNTEPATVNRMMASDRNSSCVASIDLDDLSTVWLPANGPSIGVFAAPYIPGTCLPGGDLFAAALDSENCERQGPPPVGGYVNCNGVSFLNVAGLLPEPLPYPFAPRRAEPPVRIDGIVQKVTFVGPDLDIGFFSTDVSGPAMVQELAVAGTADGDLVFIDLGVVAPDGGPVGDAGDFPCPVTMLAPRVFDVNDYVTNPVVPEITGVTALDPSSNPTLGDAVLLVSGGGGLTASGQPLPPTDRLGAAFSTPVGGSGSVLPTVSCYALPSGAQLCVTGGLVQKGVAEDEQLVVTYQGVLPSFNGLALTLTGNILVVAPGSPPADFTQLAGGLLVSESPNLTLALANASGVCGNYGLSAVTPGSLTVQPLGATACVDGDLLGTVFASGAKPFIVQGTTTGFVGALWPMDGTFQLIPGKRWHYPKDLIGMLHGAQQLADLVFGPIPNSVPAPGSSLTYPRTDGRDSEALDSPFGLALLGPLGSGTPDGGLVGGISGPFVPQPGSAWALLVSSAVSALAVNPTDADSLIDGMASYFDVSDGGLDAGIPHVYATFRGGNAMTVELDPRTAYSGGINETH